VTATKLFRPATSGFSVKEFITDLDPSLLKATMHRSLRRCVDLWIDILAGTLSRYRKLGLRDKASSTFLAGFIFRNLSYSNHQTMVLLLAVSYAAVLALIFAAGPSKVFQVMYDLSQRLRNMRFGWLILFSIMGLYLLVLNIMVIIMLRQSSLRSLL
jgi:hypothetical protein